MEEKHLVVLTKEHKYAIGIDFGHGETSAAYCEIGWGVPISQFPRREATDIELWGKEYTIISAVSEDIDGTIRIGSDILDDEVPLRDFQIGFKKEPEDINGRNEKLMMQFMSEVYKKICEKGKFCSGNHIVYIAYPSGWKNKKETKWLYSQMALQAGLPLGGLIPESRAAFIHINNANDLRNYMNKGLVVVDLGSSTLDLTYMRLETDGKITKIDDGSPLGASVIEECIMEDKVLSNSEACRLFEEYPIDKNKMLLNCRVDIKEGYYKKMASGNNLVNHTYIINHLDNDPQVQEEFENLKIKIRYEKGELEELISRKLSYQNRLKEFMLDFQQRTLKGAPIYYAFLTGGATRMGFVKKIVSEVWHLPIYENRDKEVISQDDNPSLSVSRGIAEAGRADARSNEMISALNKEKQNILNRLNITDDILNSVSAKITSEIMKVCRDAIYWFKNSNYDLSFNDLINELRSRLSRKVNIGGRLSNIANDKIRDEISNAEKRIQDIVSNYTNAKVTSMDKNISVSQDQSTAFFTSDIIASMNAMIEKEIDDILFEWIDIVGYIILGALAGIWKIINIPVNIAKLIYDWVAKSPDEIDAEKRAKAEEQKRQERAELNKKKARKLNKEQRNQVATKALDSLNRKQSELLLKIYQTLKRTSGLQNQIREESNKILEGFIEKNIEQARLLYV